MRFNKLLIVAATALAGVGGFVLFGNNETTELPGGFASGNGRIEAVQVDNSTKIAWRVRSVLAS